MTQQWWCHYYSPSPIFVSYSRRQQSPTVQANGIDFATRSCWPNDGGLIDQIKWTIEWRNRVTDPATLLFPEECGAKSNWANNAKVVKTNQHKCYRLLLLPSSLASFSGGVINDTAYPKWRGRLYTTTGVCIPAPTLLLCVLGRFFRVFRSFWRCLGSETICHHLPISFLPICFSL